MTGKRKGEKIGWTGGWLGGFLWLFLLAIVFLAQGKTAQGLTGLALVAAAVASILLASPWRHPAAPYWKLMLAPWFMFVMSILWAVWAYGGIKIVGADWWTLFWFAPAAIPFVSTGGRRWADGDDENSAPDPKPET